MFLRFETREKGRGKKKWRGKKERRKRKKDGWYRWDGHISREEKV